MAAPKSAHPGDIRQRILAESTRLFAQQGFDGTSLQAIADAVGVSKPSLLHHFSNKDAMRDQVIVDLLAHFREEIPRRLAEARGGVDRFTSAVTALVEFFGEDPDRARLVAREILDRPEATRQRLLEELAPWVGLITDAVRLGQETERVRADVDPEAYVLQVVVMALGTIASQDVTSALLGQAESPESDRRIEEMIRMARTALFVDVT